MMLTELTTTYSYLFANLINLALLQLLVNKFLSPDERRSVILSGLMSVPCFGLMVILEGEYWHPTRLGGWVLGIEDVFCSYFVAALAWFSILSLFRGRVTFNFRKSDFYKRYPLLAAISGGTVLVLFDKGFLAMTALIITYAIAAIAILILKRNLWPLVAAGIPSFLFFYLLILKLDFLLLPEFINIWNKKETWGTLILGIPLGEISWALIFAVYWPLFTAYVCNARLTAQRRQ